VDDVEVARQHRVVARWLKHFLTTTKEYVIDSSKAKVAPNSGNNSDNDYVETSSNVDNEI
jgi:hypothetical protein